MGDTRDIVERLRDVGCDREPFTPSHAECICRLANEAATEIESERERVGRLVEALREATSDTIAQRTTLHLAEAVMNGAPLPTNAPVGYWVPKALKALAAFTKDNGEGK